MITWVYVSSAVNLFSERELLDLLVVSRRNNERCNVTGVLCYARGNFMQALEGEEDAIDTLERTLRADTRHHDVTTIVRYPIWERVFGGWSMALSQLGSLSPENQAGFISLTTIRLPKAGPRPTAPIIKLLDAFRQTMT
jgi:hypothetical protein